MCVLAKICVSPPTLPTSSSSQHSRSSISFFYHIQCTVALLFRTISTIRATLVASGGIALYASSLACVSAEASATDEAFPCLGIVSSPCSPPPSSSSEGCLSLRAPPFVPSHKFATTKNQCLKHGRRQPRQLARNISALHNI